MREPIQVAVLHSTQQKMVDRLCSLLPDGFHFFGAEEMTPAMESAEVLVTSIQFPPIEFLKRVKWVHLLSAGTEHVPEAFLYCPRWTATHGGGASAAANAEWCVLMMLYFARRVPRILDYQSRRAWFENRIKEFTSTVLRGQTVGIIGYGAIGREVGRLCKALGMNVLASIGRRGKKADTAYHTPGTGDPDGQYPDEWFNLQNLRDVLPRMDFVVLGLRLSFETQQIVNRDTLKLLKSTAILINPSRGGLIDEPALIDALKRNQLAGAALDVFDHEPLPPDDPIRTAPNLLISPHCSAETQLFRDEIVNLIVANLLRFAGGEPLLNVVKRE